MNLISSKCRIIVHFVNSRLHKYIRTQKCMFCRQDTRYGWCIVYIPSYSYTDMESGDSRLFISTKIAHSLLKFLTWITRHFKNCLKDKSRTHCQPQEICKTSFWSTVPLAYPTPTQYTKDHYHLCNYKMTNLTCGKYIIIDGLKKFLCCWW
jgi:hypothetical protein